MSVEVTVVDCFASSFFWTSELRTSKLRSSSVSPCCLSSASNWAWVLMLLDFFSVASAAAICALVTVIPSRWASA